MLEPIRPALDANRPPPAAAAAAGGNYYDGYEIPIPYEATPLPSRPPARMYQNVVAGR